LRLSLPSRAGCRRQPRWCWAFRWELRRLFSLLRVVRLFGAHDRGRMEAIQRDIPGIARPLFHRVLNFVMQGAG